MEKKQSKSKYMVSLTIVCIMLLGAFLPMAQGGSTVDRVSGFDKGLSYTSVVPLKKVTFVDFDEDTLLDDYAYLAAVPTAVFRDQNRLFSHPLLFYQEEMDLDEYDKERSLDAYQGIKFFMEDWMGYCNGQLDQMTLINLQKEKLDDSWTAKDYQIIEGKNPYEIAGSLAINDWSYSDTAVVAAIGEKFKDPETIITNNIEMTLPAGNIYKEPTFSLKQTNTLNPITKDFKVKDNYVYLKAEAWWDGVLIGGKMIPTGDPDLQLYCKSEDDWMQAVTTAQWNIYRPAGHEFTYSHVYHSGDWRVGITDFPTETEAPRRGVEGAFEIQGSILGLFRPNVIYYVDVTMYPGVNVNLPDNPPYGCRDAEFTLKWDNPTVNLGFTLVGPSGEAILTVINESRTDELEIEINQLGELLEDECYSASVFSTGDVSEPVEFEIEYTWKQGIPETKGDALTSATEGAVLASSLNSPLLYTKTNALPQETKDALYKLGVKDIILIDVGGHASKEVKQDLKDICNIKKTYTDPIDIYNEIRDISGSNDIVFTTIDPWTYWYVGELEAAGETQAGLYIGPAAFSAAHHGAPVLIVDQHPELSSAVVYHNEFWHRFSYERYDFKPSVAEMYLTGTRVYDFLGKNNFDKEGHESIITVAGQYEIGVPWDRMFPGVANSGRICGTPVDTSTIISRSVFYPALIFENPALQGPVKLENGSVSVRQGLRGMLKNPYLNSLWIQRETAEDEYEYPVLCSFVTHKYRFNERASEYYGATYQCADGRIPGETTTMQAIDQGVNQKYYNQDGMYFPDMAESEVVPFYLNKGGFDAVFSTNLDKVTDNLNQGVLLWVHVSHGVHPGGGKTLFWDVSGFDKHKIAKLFAGAKHETNPWRGYDWQLGSTEEPDTMSMDMKGFIPFTNHNSLFIPATGMDWVLARKPIRELLNKIIFPRNHDIPFNVDNLYDAITGSLSYSKYSLRMKNSSEIEERIDNLHSLGFVTAICQTSNTYFHLMMIRHGSVFQVQDPWPTSWYGAIWRQSIPRDIALGYTVGEAYSRGISHVGSLYIGGGEDGPQWWWDDAENVVYFGDPDLRMYVPSTEYSNANHWEREDVKALDYDEKLSLNGHMPFGATGHPNEKHPKSFIEENLFVLVILGLIVLLLIAMSLMGRKK